MQRSLGTNYMLEVAYVGSQGRQMMMKGDPNQAPPRVGVTDANVNRPYATISPALRLVGQAQSRGYLDYKGLQMKFQRRFANNFSFLNSYTLGRVDRPELGQRRHRHADQRLRPRVQPRALRLRHHAHASRRAGSTSCRGRVSELYGGWQLSGILYLRGGLPLTVTQTQGVLSTGTGNRPNQICDGRLDNPTIDRWFDTSCFVSPTDTTGTYGNTGRGILRGPGQFNIDASLIKNTKIGRFDTEIRIEAFNLLNHPQFANPNTQIGNAAVGTISAMLSNPSCSLCGTIERQVQLGVKVRF